jgi:hypothetical protein
MDPSHKKPFVVADLMLTEYVNSRRISALLLMKYGSDRPDDVLGGPATKTAVIAAAT